MSEVPTMKDVAREAGVALKTVSRYVNGQTNINPQLSARIAAAIAQLGYRRNLAAASIRPGRTGKVLGLIISDLANPYFSTLSRAIESRAREKGYLLISASSDEDGARHDQLVDRLLEQRVDGLIVVPPRDPGRDWGDVPPPLPPLVVVDRPVPFDGADIILADNRGGARRATSTLIATGAKRIAFIGDALSIHTMEERHAGYAGALEMAGIDLGAGVTVSGAHGSEEAAEAVTSLLQSDRIDAVFAANNRASVGALLAFRSTRRRVPMIGFDDFEAATLSDPAVSVVSHDIPAMGRMAADIAIARLQGDDPPHATHVLPTKLHLRGSERP